MWQCVVGCHCQQPKAPEGVREGKSFKARAGPAGATPSPPMLAFSTNRCVLCGTYILV